jgi:hypothetical protein
MTPDMDNDPRVLIALALVAWAVALWPMARARVDTYFAARRAARAARAPKTNRWRNRWH